MGENSWEKIRCVSIYYFNVTDWRLDHQCRGLHGSKNSYPNPKRPVNVLRGTDPDPYFIWNWDPNPCRPEKCLKCTTRTRRGPDHYSKVGPEPGWEDTDPTAPVPIGTYCTANAMKSINVAKKKILFALTTVSSPLPDCDAYNPPCQYISIHVRLFLSLAVWNSLLNPLIIPASKVLAVTETDD